MEFCGVPELTHLVIGHGDGQEHPPRLSVPSVDHIQGSHEVLEGLIVLSAFQGRPAPLNGIIIGPLGG